MDRAPARSGLDRAQYADLKFWLPGDILTKVDRTSMATSLEAREPLLDHRLVEFAAALPDGLRVKGRQGKWLLKKAMERYLPDEILYRPKQGFVTPIAQWLRGPLAGKARGIAKSAMLARTGWFDNSSLAVLAEEHIAGRADHSRVLWQLIMLDRSLARLGISLIRYSVAQRHVFVALHFLQAADGALRIRTRRRPLDRALPARPRRWRTASRGSRKAHRSA